MVCKKCEKKLDTLATPEVWKDGARVGTSTKDRGVATSALLSSKRKDARSNPYSTGCKECKQPLHRKNSLFCQQCAYKKGVCSMCGVKILDTKLYRQSAK